MNRKQMIEEALVFYYLSYEAVSDRNEWFENKIILEEMYTWWGLCKCFQYVMDRNAQAWLDERWYGYNWEPPCWAENLTQVRRALKHRINFLESKLNEICTTN